MCIFLEIHLAIAVTKGPIYINILLIEYLRHSAIYNLNEIESTPKWGMLTPETKKL